MAAEEKAGQERAVERRRERAVMPPWEDMEHALERLLPRGWPRLWRGEWPSWADFGPLAGRVPRVDVLDRENEVVLRAAVPGLSKEDLEVSVSDRAVTLRGERKGEEAEAGEYVSRELSAGAFSRTVVLPAAVDAKEAKVRLTHGILEMTLPKLEAEKRHKIAIEEG
jgi:HSP20 family protein